MDDIERFNVQYGERSTLEMLRVARLATPPEQAYHWVATNPGRSWIQADGYWYSDGDEEENRGHSFDDGFFRYQLGEQLWHLGVLADSTLWHRF